VVKVFVNIIFSTGTDFLVLFHLVFNPGQIGGKRT
jgi:hypothetical protein